jgi:hypothetical protein
MRVREEFRKLGRVAYRIYHDPLGWWYQIAENKPVRLPFTFAVGYSRINEREAIIKAAEDHIRQTNTK